VVLKYVQNMIISTNVGHAWNLTIYKSNKSLIAFQLEHVNKYLNQSFDCHEESQAKIKSSSLIVPKVY
jgi:hypothetical protein